MPENKHGAHRATDRSFGGRIGRTYHDSTPWWPEPATPPEGSPNIVFIVLDDVGFSDLGCYGSEIATPNIDALAKGGLRYNNFHVTAMCSPTRACLLTGRNAHAVGMGAIAEWSCGFPGYEGRISKRAATLAEILKDSGYNTMCVGKWHLAPLETMNAAGPMDQWPTGRGFERWFGFHGALGDQWYPELFEDNHVVDVTVQNPVHLSETLTDRAIGNIKDQRAAAPHRPFFLYLAYGACHWPHHVPEAHMRRYRGKYDAGWDVVRRARFERQKELGIVPPDTELVPRNPGVSAWDDLDADRRAFSARLMESYAAFVEHTDSEIGRVVDFLRQNNIFENTLIVFVSDNGATAEGGETGTVNHRGHVFIERETKEDRKAGIDKIGSEFASNCYPEGWAQVSNTPLKWYKKDTHGGGIRTPIIFHWPGHINGGFVREQYHHAIDVAPTILDLLGIKAPEVYNGISQLPVDGTSMRYTFENDGSTTHRDKQLYEILGDRAIWEKGWKAVAKHAKGSDFSVDRWELYHLEKDFSEARDLAEQEPERLRNMVDLWWIEAERQQVLPLDDREWDRFVAMKGKKFIDEYVYYPQMARIDRLSAPDITDRSFSISAVVDISGPRPGEGVLLAYGNRLAGYVFYIAGERLHFEYVYSEKKRYLLTSSLPVPKGPCAVAYEFSRTGSRQGVGRLLINGEEVARMDQPKNWGIHAIMGGLRCGWDNGAPVSNAYTRPFTFTGRLEKVIVKVKDDGKVDPAATYTRQMTEE